MTRDGVDHSSVTAKKNVDDRKPSLTTPWPKTIVEEGVGASKHCVSDPGEASKGNDNDDENNGDIWEDDSSETDALVSSLQEGGQKSKMEIPTVDGWCNFSGRFFGLVFLAMLLCAVPLLFLEDLFYTVYRTLGVLGSVPEEGMPVIHTFFEKVDQATGMTDEADRALIKAWLDAWREAGWRPVVLTLEDARMHPDFEDLDRILGDFPFGNYDRNCFIRWIAMGAPHVNGGWMSDYDTFPLNDFTKEGLNDRLPNGGRLTVYEATDTRKWFVPSLVSGSEDEWTEMAWTLIKNYEMHTLRNFWSDMYALDDVGSRPVDTVGDEEAPIWAFDVRPSVVEGYQVFNREHELWDENECLRAKGMRAIHFSHYSIDHSKLKPGETMSDRAMIAMRYVDWWRENCSNDLFIDR